jgi:hypothetical protein
MGRRHKRPSEYRFLLELQPTLYALAIAYLLYQIRDVPCIVSALAKVQQACRIDYPDYIWLGLLAFALYGLAACGYRVYRDFYLGEYWMDLESGR